MKHWPMMLLMMAAPVAAQDVPLTATDASPAAATRLDCIPAAERAEVDAATTANRARFNLTRAGQPRSTTSVLYADPMSAPGTNSDGREIIQYVDLDATSGLLDFHCGNATYDGHQGNDIQIANFYDMDEGVPIDAAAPGTVVYTHDGEFDRNTVQDPSKVANAVIIQHADGSNALYWHMRKNSVAVTVSQTVATGDLLGLIGSSGFTDIPHLHFETQSGGAVEPSSGACYPNPTWWASQPAYSYDLPFGVYDHGISIVSLDWAGVLEHPPSKTHVRAGRATYSWQRMRNVRFNDHVTWKWYYNNTLRITHDYVWGGGGLSQIISWFSDGYNIINNTGNYGNWRVDFLHNNTLVNQDFFKVDGVANQLPTVTPQTYRIGENGFISDEFQGADPDGSVFWYRLDSGPFNGTLTQDGGRARKFRYTPNPGYVGRDSVLVHAIDDENAVGTQAQITIDVIVPTSVAQPAGSGAGIELYAPQPNPAGAGTELVYAIASASRVRLAVLDVSGRMVRTFDEGAREAGVHRVRWDARDASGRLAPNGIYFARVEAGGLSKTRRIVLAH